MNDEHWLIQGAFRVMPPKPICSHQKDPSFNITPMAMHGKKGAISTIPPQENNSNKCLGGFTNDDYINIYAGTNMIELIKML